MIGIISNFIILKVLKRIKTFGKSFIKFNCFFLSKFLLFILFFKKLAIVIIREERIGHQIGTLDCELFKASERKKKYKINTIFLFIEPLDNVANKHFRKLTGNIVNSFNFDYFIFKTNSKHHLIIKLIKEYLPSNKSLYFSSETLTQKPKKRLLNKSNTSNDILKKLKIKEEKYICIYCRDSNYLKERFKDENWDYHAYRNSNIDNFSLLANYVSKELNLEVIRIGSNPEKKINWVKNESPKIIDYSFSTYLSEKNDIDLITSCSLYINSGGGPENIAIAARKKMIRINQIPILEEIGYDFGIYIPKILKRLKDKKYISIRKAIELGISNSYDYEKYIKAGIYCEENDEIDILNAFKDLIKFQNKQFNKEEKLAIRKYKLLRKEIESKDLILKGYRNFIAPSFLLKYPGLLD